jgi:hypothetical protein
MTARSRQRLLLVLLLAVTHIEAFAFGVLAVRWGLPDYLNEFEIRVREAFRRDDALPPLAEDVLARVRARSPDSIAAMRHQLVAYIWKRDTLPTDALPDEVAEGVVDAEFADLPELRRIDRLKIVMEHGRTSTVYLFHPAAPSGGVFIYHEDHRGDFVLGKPIIARALGLGHTVAALAMPMRGRNVSNEPVTLPGVGEIRLGLDHDSLAWLEDETFSPIKLFLHPVLATVNHLERLFPGAPFAMAGQSGGGWTSTLYAAIDPRIKASFSVAGSLPLYLRGEPPLDSWGDFEQIHPPLYRIAEYLDLYVMAAAGAGRRHLQVLNYYDPCCFRPDGARGYAPAIAQVLESLGYPGQYSLHIDRSHGRHGFSRVSEDLIFAERLR